jgi:hypothetical protein
VGKSPARQWASAPSSRRASKADDAADEREEHGFREQLARDHPAAGADGDTDGELARTVGGAGGEDSGEIGAGGEQDEHGQQSDAEERVFHGVARVARGPGTAHAESETLVLRILFCHLASDSVEVFRGLLRRNAWLEAAEDDEAAVIAAAEVVPAGDLLGVDGRDPVVR